ncbi:hypothetical protein D6C85_06535 [Aureobasidium pullulans]|nr:hypothetical protein D6D03_05116 [Aureobasidium pullulans]THZ69664.1 hypothetical protein D6C85_06535 [Aureobasidium pullulans]
MDSSASEDDDNCLSCRICRFQGGLDLPTPTISDLEDLRSQSQALSISIFRHWILLNKILKRFEGQIQKRWIKRNNSQRLSVLLQAWPHMSATHRPEFATLRKIGVNNNKRRPNQAKEKEAYLWPYVNQEDLVQTHNLLIFLNSRGRHHPDKFVFGDQQQANTNKPSGMSDVDKYKMCLHGQRSPKTYGSLVLRDTGDRVQRELRMEPVAGLQVLEVQDRNLDFLVKCCRLILHDMDLDNLNLVDTKPAPPQFKSTLPVHTVTAMAQIAPYRLPQRLDMKRLRLLISARREEAEEHVWALREDPGYFAQNMREWSEHSPFMIPDKNKRPHEMVGEPAFWDKIATSMIFHAYSSLILFATADEAVTLAQEKLDSCLHKLGSSSSLPVEVEKVFQRLDYIVQVLADEPLGDLMLGFPASPPMRYGYERAPSDPSPSFNTLKIKMGRLSAAWRVQVLFRTLLSPEQQKKHGLNNTVEEIQRMLDEHSRDSDLISSWVASRFSDLALMSEVRRQLGLFQPWCTAWRSKCLIEDDAPFFFSMVECVHDFTTCAVLDAADPANFAYPSDKRRTRETVTQMRQAEKRLDKFWATVDNHCEAHTSYSVLYLLMDFFSDWNRKIHRTKAWVEPKETAGCKPIQQHNEKDDETALTETSGLPLHVFNPNACCSHPKKSELLGSITPQKAKAKTRPDGSVASPQQESRRDSATSVEEKENVEVKKLKVNKRAFKVFATMFHVPSSNEQQNTGEVAWSEFLYAMKMIGFSVEKLYGSSWQFTPDTIEASRSIQFHEPHPRAKMWYWLSKEYGRRLHRAYGWTGETFDLQ